MSAGALRVFLSSTFRDLIAEREHLVNAVFPAMRAACRERGVEFIEVDLRWGITEEESRTGQTARICLEEIDRCRPYFIGIMGSRYGWIPSMEDLRQDPELFDRFPWLREFVDNRKSIIEMEFAHGALTAANPSALFYRRTEMDGTEADSEGLARLTAAIRAAGATLRSFSSPQELGDFVRRDLLRLLDRDWPVAVTRSPLEIERSRHDAFAQNRLQSYVPMSANYDTCARHVRAAHAPLVVWGASGLGKSALMAYVAKEHAHRHPDAFIVSHFVGAADGSGPADIMRRVIKEIAARYGVTDTIPSGTEAIREQFPAWLARVPDTDPLVLLLDAVNQLDPVAQELGWLTEFIPPNVRLVVSTTPEAPLEALRRRGWDELELQPLDEAQIAVIATEFLAAYRKRFSEEQLRLIVGASQNRRPLFLRTVLEEARVHGDYVTLTRFLADTLAAVDEAELFQRVLERLEWDHGAGPVLELLRALWAARDGLTESEIAEITTLSRRRLSDLLIAMDFHLMRRDDRYTFFHGYLRSAVEARYVSGDQAQRAAHTDLGTYFSLREFSRRRLQEEPWQWHAAGDHERLQTALQRPRMLALLNDERDRYDVHRYWKSIGAIDLDGHFADSCAAEELPAVAMEHALSNAIDLLLLADDAARAEAIFRSGYPLVERIATKRETTLWLEQRAIVILNQQGKLRDAVERCNALLAEEELMDAHPHVKLEILDNLALATHRQEQFGAAEEIIGRSVALCERLYGPHSVELMTRRNSLASVLNARGEHEQAEAILLQLCDDVASHFGRSHPDVARQLLNLSGCRILAGKIENVMPDLERAERIYQSTFGTAHYDTCWCRQVKAELLIRLGDIEGARRILEDVVAVMSVKYPTHKNTAVWGITVGFTHYLQGEIAMAIPHYERWLPLLTSMLGEDNPEVVRRQTRLTGMRAALASRPRP
jgi:nephrocystin-3